MEDAGGAPAVEEFKGSLIFERDFFDIEIGEGAGLADKILGIINDGEGFQPEEIHLEESEFLGGAFGVLCGEVAFLKGDGHEVGDVLVCDDDAAGMFTGIAHHALDDTALFNNTLGDGILFDLCL